MRAWLGAGLTLLMIFAAKADIRDDLAFLGCELSVSGESLISLILHLEDRGTPLSDTVLEALTRRLQPDDQCDFNKQLEEIHPLLARVLSELVGQVSDREVVISWLQEKVSVQRESKEIRRESIAQTTASHVVTRFVEIKGGHFEIPEDLLRSKSAVLNQHLPYDFEVMDVPVTHMMWTSLMGGPPWTKNRHVDESEFLEVAINGRHHSIAPNHPVIGVSVHSMMEFANRLSIQNGYQPAYFVRPASGSAENGDISAKAVDFGFTENSLALMEGYRLPTEFEWAIMVLKTYERLNQLSLPERSAQLREWGWFKENSSALLREVGLKEPTMISGKKVFDLFGLVCEVTHDFPSHLVSQEMPFMQLRSMSVLQTSSLPNFQRADTVGETVQFYDTSKAAVGLRLVRTVRAHREGEGK